MTEPEFDQAVREWHEQELAYPTAKEHANGTLDWFGVVDGEDWFDNRGIGADLARQTMLASVGNEVSCYFALRAAIKAGEDRSHPGHIKATYFVDEILRLAMVGVENSQGGA